MHAYRTPGVYFEWVDSRPATPVALRTDVAGFVGMAAAGPLHTPVRIESWTQFETVFGGHVPHAHLAYAVEGFFANGGRTCWVVRAADPALAASAWLDLLDDRGEPALRLAAASPGVWGRQVTVSVLPGPGERFGLLVRAGDRRSEVWRDLSLDENDRERYVARVLADERTGSRLVRVDAGPSLAARSGQKPGVRDQGLAAVTLPDTTGRPALKLRAPAGGWGRDMTVAVWHAGTERFSLALQPPGGGRELWPDLSMALDDPRCVVRVLQQSQLARAEVLAGSAPWPWNRPQAGALRLHTGRAGMAGGDDGLVPWLDLLDRTGQPTLRLTAAGPFAQETGITAAVGPGEGDRFSLEIAAGDSRDRRWERLTMTAAALELLDEDVRPVLRLAAPGPGSWAYAMTARVQRAGGGRFSLLLRLPDGREEGWPDLTMDTNDPRYVEAVLNDPLTGSHWVAAVDLQAGLQPRPPDPAAPNLRDGVGQFVPESDYVELVINDPRRGSALVRAQDLASPARLPDSTPDPQARNPENGAARLAGGLVPAHLTGVNAPLDSVWGLAALARVDEVSIVALPDLMATSAERHERRPRPRCDVPDADFSEAQPPAPVFPPELSDAQVEEGQRALINHCEQLRDRIALLDAPPALAIGPGRADPATTGVLLDRIVVWRNQFSTSYAACYYPWLRGPDPAAGQGRLRDLPPSGHLAGMYARVDRETGVHKPPANEAIEGVNDVTAALDDALHGELNEAGVNAIRAYGPRGIRAAGARTLCRDSEWRYINVRRLMIMIAETIDERLQWTVFEPNNPRLWRDVDRVVSSFLDRLWQRGMLDGATAGEAYQVRCDEETNVPQETDLGRLICEIQVKPPWPAEFVVVRIGITESGTEVLESAALRGGPGSGEGDDG